MTVEIATWRARHRYQPEEREYRLLNKSGLHQQTTYAVEMRLGEEWTPVCEANPLSGAPAEVAIGALAKLAELLQHNARSGFNVVRKSNFDHEDWRGDQYFIAKNLEEKHAKRIADALNVAEGEHSDDFFKVVPADYVLPPKWEP